MSGIYYENRRNHSLGMALILLFLVAIIVILINLGQKIGAYELPLKEKTELTGTDSVLNEFNLQDLVKNASYSIVGISKLNKKNTSIFLENAEEKLGMGSGIILTSDGYILSNYQTTGGRDETCFVTLRNGTIYPAIVKWGDIDLDVSIVKIDTNHLLYLPMGDSNHIEIGDKYYLLSNTTGCDFNITLTTRYISQNMTTRKVFQENKIVYAEDVIKWSSEIQYNEVGGAFLNETGEVLGIASAKINAMIPINRVKRILERLKEDEEFKEAYLGINGFDNHILKYFAPEYPLKIGIYVDNIKENSPICGQLLVGDIITKIDNYELSYFQELYEYLYQKNPGEKIKLTVVRGTKEVVIETILMEKPR